LAEHNLVSLSGIRYRVATVTSPLAITHTFSRAFVSNRTGTIPVRTTDAPGAPFMPGADIRWVSEYALGSGTLRTGSFLVKSADDSVDYLGTRNIGAWMSGSMCLWGDVDGKSEQWILNFFSEALPRITDGVAVLDSKTNTFSEHGEEVTVGVAGVGALLLRRKGRNGAPTQAGHPVLAGQLYRTDKTAEPLLLETASASVTFAPRPHSSPSGGLALIDKLASIELM